MKKTNRLQKLIALAVIAVFAVSLMSMIPDVQKDPWVIPSKYKKMKNPTKPNKENLNIGKSLYNKHCKSCHGKKGKGDGTKARELKTKMMDFTTKKFKAFSDGEMYYMSVIGRDEMPNFEKKIPKKEDRWFVVNYIKTFK